MKTLVEEVFVTEGVPQITFVQPSNFNEILLDMRRSGKPVIIEGQSGTGKTTCVKKILDMLGDDKEVQYLTARNVTDVSKIKQIVEDRLPGTFVIDDFHRLSQKLQTDLADLAKVAADQSAEGHLPKLVLIGINQVGSDLIQLVPDIAKRTGIHRIKPGSEDSIRELIESGCNALNITIKNTEIIFKESKGDYWLTQQLCQSICTLNDVLESQNNPQVLDFEIRILRQNVVDKLHSAYYPATKDFCRGHRFRSSNDPYYKLLKAVSQQEGSIVDLNILANTKSEVRGSINNIKGHRLNVLLESKPTCSRHFYYNSETKNFAIEDPALFYFLKHLNWDHLRVDCGFKETDKDYEFDIALSFAGENRELAEYIAEQLGILDANVFYDKYFESNFLGSTWSRQFKKIFSEDSRLVVCLLDKHHNDKIWPTFERECFQPRVNDEAVIPIFLDSTSFVGIPKDLIGIKFSWSADDSDWKDKVIDNIVLKVMERLG
ncbi:MAG: TIR domain-containing protein [Nitrospinae bacterium]|nr:TIR domain-containing protein [Nitrospinota bacterium]